ncbi:MAG TPA: LemA family protein [Alphaproteobacteria bacterium]|jgi:LemA protein|nr:LemA family protein [Alphaproteobacteria bacterium]
MIYILIGTVAILIFWVVSVYNFFVSSKTRVEAANQEINNQLKRQSELIPNLESSVKGYLKHEKGILDMLADARKMISQGKDASKKISELLPKLQIVVESNPQLKGSEVVTNLMNELRDTSDKVMYARRLMIDLTADYNVKRVTFPSNSVAKIFNFEALKGLEVSEFETKTPKISL